MKTILTIVAVLAASSLRAQTNSDAGFAAEVANTNAQAHAESKAALLPEPPKSAILYNGNLHSEVLHRDVLVQLAYMPDDSKWPVPVTERQNTLDSLQTADVGSNPEPHSVGTICTKSIDAIPMGTARLILREPKTMEIFYESPETGVSLTASVEGALNQACDQVPAVDPNSNGKIQFQIPQIGFGLDGHTNQLILLGTNFWVDVDSNGATQSVNGVHFSKVWAHTFIAQDLAGTFWIDGRRQSPPEVAGGVGFPLDR